MLRALRERVGALAHIGVKHMDGRSPLARANLGVRFGVLYDTAHSWQGGPAATGVEQPGV